MESGSNGTVHDLYLKHRDKSGSERIECHRVWDSARFFESARAAARREGGDVHMSSRFEYRHARWPMSSARSEQ